MTKRPHSTRKLQSLRLDTMHLATGCIVGLDIAKTKMVGVIADWEGRPLVAFHWEHPAETRQFVSVVLELRGYAGGQLRVAMEPTGTYGDAVRELLIGEDIEVWMVSPKKTHDMREVVDGSPGSNDPKSARIVAELCARGRGRRYEVPSASSRELRAFVDRRRQIAGQEEVLEGQLEATLARYWPEAEQYVNVQSSKAFLRLLAEYGGPEAIAKDAERAKKSFVEWCHHAVAPAKVDGLIASTKGSVGVAMLSAERSGVQVLCEDLLTLRGRAKRLEDELGRELSKDAAASRMGDLVGVYTAAVVAVYLRPLSMESPRAMEKAAGLNLRVESSGNKTGRPSITKRGPSEVRRVLYMLALRFVWSDDLTYAWYVSRQAHKGGRKTGALVAVMRKLLRALWHVARGETFEATKLFDAARLHALLERRRTDVRRVKTSSTAVKTAEEEVA